MKEVTLEDGRKIHVNEKAFNNFMDAIKEQNVNRIVKHNLEMVASCPEFKEDFIKKLKEFKEKKTDHIYTEKVKKIIG